MFFEKPAQIVEIAEKCGFSVFEISKLNNFSVQNPPKNTQNPSKLPKNAQNRTKSAKNSQNPALTLNFPPNTLIVTPDDKGKIGIEQVRNVAEHTATRQKSAQFVVFYQADALTEQAQNAILKLLEEPAEHYHYVFITERAGKLLPTVLSRANLYILRENAPLTAPVVAEERVKSLAKQLLSANPRQIVPLMEEITSKKVKNPRELATQVTDTAIELAYKSYFATGNPAFIKKLPKLLSLAENLQANGNLKLHLVADLL